MSAAVELRTVKTASGEVVYDADMPMGVLKTLMASATGGDLGGLMEGFSQVIKSWPFEGSPAELEAWDALRRSEFNEVITAVMEDLGEQGNA